MAEDRELKIKRLLELYKNVPFVHNGRTLQGLDCLGFIVHFYKHFGINLPENDGAEIEEDWYKYDSQRYIRSLRKLDGVQVSLNDLHSSSLVPASPAQDNKLKRCLAPF
jgi:hypothetical protein